MSGCTGNPDSLKGYVAQQYKHGNVSRYGAQSYSGRETSYIEETLARILHVTGNDRLGTTAIYLNLIDMHVVDESMNTLRSGRGSFSSRLEILD